MCANRVQVHRLPARLSADQPPVTPYEPKEEETDPDGPRARRAFARVPAVVPRCGRSVPVWAPPRLSHIGSDVADSALGGPLVVEGPPAGGTLLLPVRNRAMHRVRVTPRWPLTWYGCGVWTRKTTDPRGKRRPALRISQSRLPRAGLSGHGEHRGQHRLSCLHGGATRRARPAATTRTRPGTGCRRPILIRSAVFGRARTQNMIKSGVAMLGASPWVLNSSAISEYGRR